MDTRTGKRRTRSTTSVATSGAGSVTVRGKDLVGELIGRRGFTEMLYFLTCGRMPHMGEVRVLDACLVTLMEHGWTPASLVARLAADSAPGQAQVALAAGLLAVGDACAGPMERCAMILAEGADAADPDAFCADVVARHRVGRQAVPGFGHPVHTPDDPRPPRLFQVAAEAGCEGRHVALLRRLGTHLDRAAGRHLTINAMGAAAALLLEIGMPAGIMRGIAVVSRAGGLAGHLVEEEQTHAAREIRRLAEEGIPYEAPPEEDA